MPPEPTVTELRGHEIALELGDAESDEEERRERPDPEPDFFEESGIWLESDLPKIPSAALLWAIKDTLRAVGGGRTVGLNRTGSSAYLWARNRQLVRLVELPWLPDVSCSILASDARMLATRLRNAGEVVAEVSAVDRLWSIDLGRDTALVPVCPSVPLPEGWDAQSTVSFDPEYLSELARGTSEDPILLHWHPLDGLRFVVGPGSSTAPTSWSGPADEGCWQVSPRDLKCALTPTGSADWRFALATNGESAAFLAERHVRLAGRSCRVVTVLDLSPHAAPPRHEAQPSELDAVLSELCED